MALLELIRVEDKDGEKILVFAGITRNTPPKGSFYDPECNPKNLSAKQPIEEKQTESYASKVSRIFTDMGFQRSSLREW
jgi:hypothetical protein